MKRINNTIQFTKTETNRILKFYGNGQGLNVIAKTFGVSVATIRKTLVDNKVTIRGRGRVAFA